MDCKANWIIEPRSLSVKRRAVKWFSNKTLASTRTCTNHLWVLLSEFIYWSLWTNAGWEIWKDAQKGACVQCAWTHTHECNFWTNSGSLKCKEILLWNETVFQPWVSNPFDFIVKLPSSELSEVLMRNDGFPLRRLWTNWSCPAVRLNQ